MAGIVSSGAVHIEFGSRVGPVKVDSSDRFCRGADHGRSNGYISVICGRGADQIVKIGVVEFRDSRTRLNIKSQRSVLMVKIGIFKIEVPPFPGVTPLTIFVPYSIIFSV